MTGTRIDDAMRTIAAWGLPGAEPAEPFRAADDEEWAALLRRIRFERINGLAVEAAAAGALDLTEEQAGQLFKLHRDGMTWCLAAERKLLRLADAFDADGIAYAVLKGPALAHTVYEEPCLRPFGDLDLLVRSRDYDHAAALLGRLGHVRRRPEPRPGWEARFGKASVHIHPDDGIEVDLHRTLVLGPFGQWIDGDELMAHRATFELGGRSLPRLDDTGALLNVALHAALGWAAPRLAPLRDCAELHGRGSIDGERLGRWASAWHLGAALERARGQVEAQIGVGAPLGLAWIAPSRVRDRRLLEAYGGGDRQLSLPLSTFRAIPGLRAKVAYGWSLAFPQRDFLTSRGIVAGSRASVKRLVSPARRALARPGRGDIR